MRHLWSLLSGLAATAVVMSLFSADLQHENTWWRFGRLIVAGLILGLVATLRISPVGPLAGGLLLLTPLTLLQTAHGVYADIFLAGYGFDIGQFQLRWSELGSTAALLGMAGAMMVVAVISAQRWKAWPKPGFDSLVDNGRIEGLEPWSRQSLDDTVPTAAGAHDGITAQLWVPPPPR
jgi:hypothetical protein